MEDVEAISKKYEEELRVIKRFLTLNPGKPKYMVSAVTGVSLDIIREFIDCGILIEEHGALKEESQVRSSTQNRRELLHRLRSSIIEDRLQGRTTNRYK